MGSLNVLYRLMHVQLSPELQVRLMYDFNHTNILKFREWYETSQHIWVITELGNGGTLADILEQDGYIPFLRVSDFLRDIVAGLHYLHSRKILYCDLQPSKVCLGLIGT